MSSITRVFGRSMRMFSTSAVVAASTKLSYNDSIISIYCKVLNTGKQEPTHLSIISGNSKEKNYKITPYMKDKKNKAYKFENIESAPVDYYTYH